MKLRNFDSISQFFLDYLNTKEEDLTVHNKHAYSEILFE